MGTTSDIIYDLPMNLGGIQQQHATRESTQHKERMADDLADELVPSGIC